MPDELWTEVRDIVEETGIKTIPKKTGDIMGTFHARMGTIKDRNIKDLREAEEIKKRWQEYTEELYLKKVLMMR